VPNVRWPDCGRRPPRLRLCGLLPALVRPQLLPLFPLLPILLRLILTLGSCILILLRSPITPMHLRASAVSQDHPGEAGGPMGDCRQRPTRGARWGEAYRGAGYCLAAAEAASRRGTWWGSSGEWLGLRKASRWSGSPYNLWQARAAQKAGVDLASVCWRVSRRERSGSGPRDAGPALTRDDITRNAKAPVKYSREDSKWTRTLPRPGTPRT
jgi:hypothetical protein